MATKKAPRAKRQTPKSSKSEKPIESSPVERKVEKPERVKEEPDRNKKVKWIEVTGIAQKEAFWHGKRLHPGELYTIKVEQGKIPEWFDVKE